MYRFTVLVLLLLFIFPVTADIEEVPSEDNGYFRDCMESRIETALIFVRDIPFATSLDMSNESEAEQLNELLSFDFTTEDYYQAQGYQLAIVFWTTDTDDKAYSYFLAIEGGLVRIITWTEFGRENVEPNCQDTLIQFSDFASWVATYLVDEGVDL